MTSQSVDYRKIVAGIAMRTRIHPPMLRAVSLARSSGGEVALVHAVEKEGQEAESAVIEDASGRCAELKDRYPEITAACVKSGSSWSAILETARGSDADLIVISSHVHSWLAARLGRPSNHVLHHAVCDVLVARTERYTEDLIPENYAHVLLATDLRLEHHVVAERAAGFARRQGAKLSLLHVVEHFPVDRENEDIAPEDVDPETHQKKVRGERLARLAEDIGEPDVPRTVVVTPDSARSAIAEHAQRTSPDLIVIGSRKSTGLTMLLGTTGDYLVNHGPCDVLAVHVGG
jgi:universal stress protein A